MPDLDSRAPGCCALDLDDGHDGPCTWLCNSCDGKAKCWACGGDAGLDDVTSCSECDSTGDCLHCTDGMEVDQ